MPCGQAPSRRTRTLPAACARQVAVAVCLVASGAAVRAQSIEPRAYSNAPVGTNFLVVGYSESRGGVPSDTALPVTDPQLCVRSGALGFATVLALGGRTAKFDIAVPYSSLSGSAKYLDTAVQREVDGFGDPVLRLSWNFLGAPALRASEFRAWRQDLIVGASLQVSVPFGQYDSSKVVNLGTNRWFLKPEIGVSKALGRWTLEAQGAVTFFSANDDFFGGNRREQDPLYSLQGHLIYDIGPGKWISLDATHFGGGRTSLNGVLNKDLQKNWRAGVTLALPVNAQHSVKLFASSGLSARTGNDFDLLGLAWQYRWSARN
jgi:hypothetical protein